MTSETETQPEIEAVLCYESRDGNARACFARICERKRPRRLIEEIRAPGGSEVNVRQSVERKYPGIEYR